MTTSGGKNGGSRRARIDAARRALAEAHAADPAGVGAYQSRIRLIEAARKRERERFERLVLGIEQPAPAMAPMIRPSGMSRLDWKIERKRLLAEHAAMVADWNSQQRRGPLVSTEAYSRAHSDAIIQLQRNGTITEEQAEWVAQIANVHRSIEADVAMTVASLHARVDNEGGRAGQVAEGVQRVRMHHAYTLWRNGLPAPKALVLDMIVGDAIGYTVAARQYRVGNVTARTRLLRAIDRWPDCVAAAYRNVDQDDVDRMNAAE